MSQRRRASLGFTIVVGAWLMACSTDDAPKPHGQGGAAGSALVDASAGSGGNGGGTTTGGGGSGIGGTSIGVPDASPVDVGPRSDGAPPPPTPVTIDQCTGKVDAATFTALKAGGPTGSLKWIYPYDATVFPRGLYPPLAQWTPASTDSATAVYLHMRSAYFEYHGCFGATNPARVQIPSDVWTTAEIKNQGASDPLVVELSTLAAGKAAGPVAAQWLLASGSLKGSVYYNTYDSPLANNTGAVIRVKSGENSARRFISAASGDGGCVSCHSISSNGKVLLAAHHYLFTIGKTDFSASWDLSGRVDSDPPTMATSLDEAGFGALYPDGSKFLSMGSPTTGSGVQLPGPGNIPGMTGPRDSRLFDTKSGAQLQAPGWDVKHANMPMFAPSGDKVVFNDYDVSLGHSIFVMDFDGATNSFANKVTIFKDDTRFPGWPVFTPDSRSVIFALGDKADYTTFDQLARSDLMMVDIATKTATPLKIADGFKNGMFYLPGGEKRDAHLSFYTTMHAVPSGGYGWLFFTSERTYGNVITDAIADPAVFGSTTPSRVKKIWVAAVDLNAAPGTDPSHPAIYLPGQEEASGNHRAFAALDPCTMDGTSCTSGTDCCSGFCTDGKCGTPPDPRCSNTDEKCTTSADCCNPLLMCIGGICTFPQPPK